MDTDLDISGEFLQRSNAQKLFSLFDDKEVSFSVQTTSPPESVNRYKTRIQFALNRYTSNIQFSAAYVKFSLIFLEIQIFQTYQSTPCMSTTTV